jgi:hypothetical protein
LKLKRDKRLFHSLLPRKLLPIWNGSVSVFSRNIFDCCESGGLRYAPVTLGCDPDDRFVESLQMEPVISFFLDSLIAGDSVLRERVLQVFRKDGTIYELRDYVERKREEEARHYQEEKIA